MVTYEKLASRPSTFKSLTGMTVEAFDRLLEEFVPAHLHRLAHSLTKRNAHPRKRAVGCGRQHVHSLRDRLLMALFWLRVSPTYEVLGFYFSLHKTNARLNVEEILDTLLGRTAFGFERPNAERRKLASLQAVMDAFPDVALVIDSKEQRIRRPSGEEDEREARPRDSAPPPSDFRPSAPLPSDFRPSAPPPSDFRPSAPLPSGQRPYYSGKKKAHTLKTQIAVRPDGLIEALSESVPGSTHDLTLLRETGLIERLEADEGAMRDKGYDGIARDAPDRELYLPFQARRNRPLTEGEREYNAFLSGYRIVVEHTNAQLNKYQVLTQVYRPARDRHTRTVRGGRDW